MIHIGRSRTQRTRCKKPVARRWWVEDVHTRHGIGPGSLRVFEVVRPMGVSCPACLAAPEMPQ